MTLDSLPPFKQLKIKNNRRKQTHTQNAYKKAAQDRRTSMAKKGTGGKKGGGGISDSL